MPTIRRPSPRRAAAASAQPGARVIALLGAVTLLLLLIVSLPGVAWVAGDKGKADPATSPERQAVDVVFVVDATGSMDAHIKNLTNSAARLAEQLELRKIDARFAVTIYRDRVDDVGNKPEDPFVLRAGEADFTKNLAELAKKLGEVKADGGGDFPESAFDALDFSSKLPFAKDARKVLVLVTDAPPRAPDKDIKDEAQLAKNLLERGIDQFHVLHDLEPERYQKLQKALGKAAGRTIPLFPGGVEKMQQAMADIGRDISGPGPAVAKLPLAEGKLDVVFVLDTTGSMGADLGALRDHFKRFADVLRGARADFQIGVVTFRDRIEDPVETRDPRSILFGGKEFTSDADAAAAEIAKLSADGGGDEPESGLDALDFASRRPFRPGARKVVVLLTDASPRVPDKDMKDEDQVARLFKDRGIDQYHLIARGGLDRYARLASLHGAGRVINLGKGDDFASGLVEIGRDAVGGMKGGAAVASNKVDIMLLLDATGSMEGQINGARDNLKRLLADLEAKKLDARLGVTVFRDAVDMVANTPEDPFVLKVGGDEFTKNIDGLINEINDKAKAKDGGDTPESGFDAMVFAAQRSFRPDATRVLIMLTDAPPRAPDKKTKDERETAEALTKHGIHQLHLIVRENPKLYEEVQRLIEKGGRSAGLKINLDEGKTFDRMFDAIAEGIAARLGPVEPPPVVAGGGASRVDIVFVVDTTGSMDLGPWRDSLRDFDKVLRDAKVDFQLGLVTFKDRKDDPPETKEPRAHLPGGKEFTRNVEELITEAGMITVGGGGDDPESGLDALEFATRRGFRPGARKVFIMFTDAPPRIPDVDMKDEDQVARIFKERGVEQFHLIGRNAVDRYEKLARMTGRGGKVVRPDRGDDFKAGMIGIAREAASGVFSAAKVDVVFVLDTTGSMEAPMRNLKEQVARFTGALRDAGADFRVGVVTFTDRVEDAAPGNEHRALKFGGDSEFTKDADEVSRELAKLNAFGGGDAPESGFDALEFASRRAFRPDARKVFVLITDEGPRVPDKDMKDEDQVGKLLKERGIDTLHLLHGNNHDRYVKIAKMLPREGKIIDLGKIGAGDAFKNSLEDIARASTGAAAGGERVLPIAGTRVDLIFVVDTTGSMGDFNGNTMQPAERIVKKLQDEKVDVRMSLVDFKDRHPVDGNMAVDHRIVLLNGKEFTGSLEDFRAGVNSLRADGGGDAPESSFDALAFAAKREFRLDSLKVLVLITDEGPKVPDKDVKDENDVLRIFKDRGIHQLHLIVGANAERYNTLQRLMGKEGKPAGKSTAIGNRGTDGFNKDLDTMAVAILDQLRTDARIRLSDRPLPPLALEKTAKGQGMVDVVFVLDVTASMGPDIGLLKEGAPKMLKKLQDLNLDVRFGVTSFRDRIDKADGPPEEPQALLFLGSEFTSDMGEFLRQLNAVTAKGGGDVEESSLDALEFASRRPFRRGAHKVLVLITDAPPRIPDKDMKDEFQLGELLRERGIQQLHLLLRGEPHRYVTVQRFLTGDGAPAGTHYDLGPIGRSERAVERLMDSLSRSIAADNRRGLASMAKGK